MSIIAWIVLGAIAGYLAGFLVKGDEGLGVIGHIVLGIVGALVGGFLASVLFNTKPDRRPVRLSSIVVAVIGAIITVVVVNMVMGRSRTGRGASDHRRPRGRPPTFHRTPTERWAFCHVWGPGVHDAWRADPKRTACHGTSLQRPSHRVGRSREPPVAMLGQVGPRATGGPRADVLNHRPSPSRTLQGR